MFSNFFNRNHSRAYRLLKEKIDAIQKAKIDRTHNKIQTIKRQVRDESNLLFQETVQVKGHSSRSTDFTSLKTFLGLSLVVYGVSGESNESISKAFNCNIDNIGESLNTIGEKYDHLIIKRIEMIKPVDSEISRPGPSTSGSDEMAGNLELLKELLEFREEMFDFLTRSGELKVSLTDYSNTLSGSFRLARFFKNHFSTTTRRCNSLALQMSNELNHIKAEMDMMEDYASFPGSEFEFTMINRRLINLKHQIGELETKYLENWMFFMKEMGSSTLTRVDILTAVEDAKLEVASPEERMEIQVVAEKFLNSRKTPSREREIILEDQLRSLQSEFNLEPRRQTSVSERSINTPLEKKIENFFSNLSIFFLI